MLWASSRLKNTTASAVSAPFLVAPNDRMSTPAFHVASAGVEPSRATALARRAPSRCTQRRRARATSTIARTSASVYTVLASVPWVMLTARGGTSDRKSTRLNSSHSQISYAVFCLKKKKKKKKKQLIKKKIKKNKKK